MAVKLRRFAVIGVPPPVIEGNSRGSGVCWPGFQQVVRRPMLVVEPMPQLWISQFSFRSVASTQVRSSVPARMACIERCSASDLAFAAA